MSDDTTTWLKKNSSINPLRRSIKTSLRFHVPEADMDASIISNPDKAKNQDLFIPRMLQRQKIQMRMSRANQFKVPEMVVSKPVKKKENMPGPAIKAKKSPALPRKSCLPVARSRPPGPERESTKMSLPRPSMIPGGSGKALAARRQIIQKMIELSEIKKPKENESNQLNVTSSDNSVLRSILKKKRASLRRSLRMSGSKPKAKKVLFDGFQSSNVEEKENLTISPMAQQIQKESNFEPLEEPCVSLNFPRHSLANPANVSDPQPSMSLDPDDVNSLLKCWNSYREKVNGLQSIQNSLRNSVESLLAQTKAIQEEYDSFKKNSAEIYTNLSKLSDELEENLKRALDGRDFESTKPKRRSGGKKLEEKIEKIRLSDKSKAIKKGSGKKSMATIKNGFLKDMEDSFSLVYKKSFTDN